MQAESNWTGNGCTLGKNNKADWICSYFIWKYLKPTWIKEIANEGCNYEQVKCFESFLLQTFKPKDDWYL